MRDHFLPFSPPLVGDEEIAEVVDALRSDWITTGPKVGRFEGDFVAFAGAPAALALNSCTAALHVGLVTLGVGPGDAVISTPMTFCSSIHVIEHTGALPLLVDVEPDTLNLDPALVAQAVRDLAEGGPAADRWLPPSLRANAQTSERADVPACQRSSVPTCERANVRAMLPVHLYGHPCDMDPLLAIAREHGLAIVEDAAHALPARYKGRLIGAAPEPSSGQPAPDSGNSAPDASRITPHVSSVTHHVSRLTCFSFYATKNLTTAEGGMLTGAPELIDEARIWSLHGMSRDAWKRYSAEGSWYYEVIRPGFKYNMTDIQAALGIHQLRRLPAFQARRHEIVRRYTAAFSELPELQCPTERPEVEHAWHIYALRLRLDRLRLDRGGFIEELNARHIGTSVHFIPIHLLPYYRDKYGYRPEDFPVAYREYRRLVSLPLYPRMSDADVQDVIDAVTDVVARHRC